MISTIYTFYLVVTVSNFVAGLNYGLISEILKYVPGVLLILNFQGIAQTGINDDFEGKETSVIRECER